MRQALLLSSRARPPVREQRPVEQASQVLPPFSPVPERVPGAARKNQEVVDVAN